MVIWNVDGYHLMVTDDDDACENVGHADGSGRVGVPSD